MGVYYLIYCDELKEYFSPDKFNMSIKNWIHPTHGMIVTWLMHTRWHEKNVQMVNDCHDEPYYNIRHDYKNIEMEIMHDFNEYLKSNNYQQYMLCEECCQFVDSCRCDK